MSTAILPEQQQQQPASLQQQQQQQQQQQGGGYKSFLKPTKFWKSSSNNKVASSPEEQQQHQPGKPFALTMPTFKKPGLLQPKEQPVNALRETPKAEIYKLSTINDSGVYLPPSPTQEGKRDHWLDLDEQVLAFRLPAPECLTTYGSPQPKGESLFHTPSVIINQQQHHHHQSSVSTSTTEDDIPSLMTDSSSTSPL